MRISPFFPKLGRARRFLSHNKRSNIFFSFLESNYAIICGSHFFPFGTGRSSFMILSYLINRDTDPIFFLRGTRQTSFIIPWYLKKIEINIYNVWMWNTYRVAFLLGKSDKTVISIPFIKLIAPVWAQTSSSIDLTQQLHWTPLADPNLLLQEIYM